MPRRLREIDAIKLSQRLAFRCTFAYAAREAMVERNFRCQPQLKPR
jgi:hypothetical protein